MYIANTNQSMLYMNTSKSEVKDFDVNYNFCKSHVEDTNHELNIDCMRIHTEKLIQLLNLNKWSNHDMFDLLESMAYVANYENNKEKLYEIIECEKQVFQNSVDIKVSSSFSSLFSDNSTSGSLKRQTAMDAHLENGTYVVSDTNVITQHKAPTIKAISDSWQEFIVDHKHNTKITRTRSLTFDGEEDFVSIHGFAVPVPKKNKFII